MFGLFGYQHKASIKKLLIMMIKTKRYQLDFKVWISKLGANDQQINKSLHIHAFRPISTDIGDRLAVCGR